MSVPAELNHDGFDQEEDALRALVSSILSGQHEEQVYLRQVSARCLQEPESAPTLLGIIDRYYRLGRMPAEQYQKIKAKIEEAMGTRPPASESADTRDDRDDDGPAESITADVTPMGAHSPGAAPPSSNPPRYSPPPSRSRPPRSSQPLSSPPLSPLSSPPLSRLPPSSPPLSRPRPSIATAADARPVRIGIGTVLRDRYELLQLLGRGGMASVYKARDRYRTSIGVADCLVAIKIVQPHPSRPGSVEALGREFHNAQRLSHPNVVNVYDIDHEGDASFYSMEFLEGERLNSLIRQTGLVFPRRYALAIIRDIGAAVAHAHARGVVHADLKPHNIMITNDGHVRVLDFGSGIVRPGEPWISELSPGGDYRQATPAYASSEQLQGWCADPRDDIYALACLAYQLLAGRHPFDHRSALVARGRRMRPHRPSGMRGDSWRALRRGLSWSREQRNLSMEKWLEQLNLSDAAEALPPLARLAVAPPSLQWPRRAAVAAVVLFSVGLASFAYQRQSGTDWHQVLASARASLQHLWQELPSTMGGEPAPTGPPPWMAPVTPRPVTAVTAAGSKLIAPAPPGGRTKTARAAPSATAPSVVAMADVPNATSALSAPSAPNAPNALSDGPASPRVEFAAASYEVAGSEPAARIVVRRAGGTDGDVSFVWWTEGASAQPDVDYASLGRRVETIPSGADKITVYVPIISNSQRSHSGQFYVALAEPNGGGKFVTSGRATVMIDRGD